jgi:LPXTG-motif cell wall-anchored protein
LPSTGTSNGTQLAHTGVAQTVGYGLAGGVLVLTGAGMIGFGRRRIA